MEIIFRDIFVNLEMKLKFQQLAVMGTSNINEFDVLNNYDFA